MGRIHQVFAHLSETVSLLVQAAHFVWSHVWAFL